MTRRRRRLKLVCAAYLLGEEDALRGTALRDLRFPVTLILPEERGAYAEGFLAGEAKYNQAMQAMRALAGTHDYRVEGVK